MKVLSFTVLADQVAPSLPALGDMLNTATIAAGISFFVPIVVAFITKREASDRVKAVINLIAVALASVIALFLTGNDGQPITLALVVSTFIAGLTSSIVAFKAAWKPLKVTSAAANAAPNTGIGTPVPSVIETARPGDGAENV